MEGLTGPAVKLTLYIKEGRGFGFLQNPIVIVARLSSNTLQTNIYPPVAEPQFHEELLWEVDKQTLRRLRTGKVPVKVECFTLTKQNQRSKVGTVLLDLRSAHIVAKGRSAHAAPDSWHKMQCGSGRCPEMLLCLRVEDMKNESLACGDVASVKSPRETFRATSVSPDSDTLIQVGPVMMATDMLQLTICMESQDTKPLCNAHFTCQAFGSEIKSKPFDSNAKSESIVSIRSSLHFLRQYLEKTPLLIIKFISDCDEIGSTQLDIGNLVPTSSVTEFLELHADNDRTMKFEQRCIVTRKHISPDDLVITVTVRLKHCGPEQNDLAFPESRSSRTEAAGDGDIIARVTENPIADTTVTTETQRLNLYDRPQTDVVASSSDSRLLKPCAAVPSLVSSEPELNVHAFHAFSLRVELQSVVLHARPCGQKLRFSLQHPQAHVIEGLGEGEIPPPGDITALPDVEGRLKFVSTMDEIGRLLLAYPPKVTVQCAGAGGWVALASTALDTSRLLAERRRVVFPAPLLDAQGSEVGVLYVALDLRDDGARPERERQVGPAVLDERIAHEALEELEEWKERQKEHFKTQLSTKMTEHLQQLTADFERRCLGREKQLESALKQTSELTERLERELAACTQREAMQMRAQATLELRAEQLEQRFATQVQMLRDASTRMEDDLMHKAKLNENACTELVDANERLQKENAALRKALEERDLELFGSQLTREQTAAILQDLRVLEEKLDASGRSKAYFKEQWRAVAHELHQLKTAQHAQMQMQIRDSKHSIQALGFQRLLNKEAEELDRDQTVLQQLKSELGKDFTSSNDSRERNLSPRPDNNNQSKSVKTQDLLHSLIEERDVLIGSGRFNLNDNAIDRINRQIRSQTSLM